MHERLEVEGSGLSQRPIRIHLEGKQTLRPSIKLKRYIASAMTYPITHWTFILVLRTVECFSYLVKLTLLFFHGYEMLAPTPAGWGFSSEVEPDTGNGGFDKSVVPERAGRDRVE